MSQSRAPFFSPHKGNSEYQGETSVERSYLNQMYIYKMVPGMNVTTTAQQRMSPSLAAKALGEDKELDSAKNLLPLQFF